MNLQLQNKIAFIAGSSDGLGFATALELAREKARVVLTGRSPEKLEKAEKKIRQEIPHAEILLCPIELTKEDDIKKAIEKTIHTFKSLDILITNAGGPPTGTFETLDENKWATAFQLGLMSAVRLIRHALPHLRKSEHPSILTIIGTSAKQPIPGLLLSNVFRPAIWGLTKTLSIELAASNIRVNSILPGSIRTERNKTLLESYASMNKTSIDSETARMVSDIPLYRIADPHEFAKVATFLVSPAASYITGHALPVDGGKIKGL